MSHSWQGRVDAGKCLADGGTGAEQWLRQLLGRLEVKIDAPDQPINPFTVFNID